jgi:hypothetical protein
MDGHNPERASSKSLDFNRFKDVTSVVRISATAGHYRGMGVLIPLLVLVWFVCGSVRFSGFVRRNNRREETRHDRAERPRDNYLEEVR